MIEHAKNRWGVVYPYFVCQGRRRRTTDCTRQAMLITAVEELIEDEYRTVVLGTELRDSIEDLVNDDFDQLHASAETERRNLEAQQSKLANQRLKLLEAHYAGAIPIELLKTEQDRIAAELAKIGKLLDAAGGAYEHARKNLADCLDMAADCHNAYLEADDSTRRLFNQAFFSKIYIDEDGTVRFDYNPPFDALLGRTISAAAHARLLAKGELTTQPDDHDTGAQQRARRISPTGSSKPCSANLSLTEPVQGSDKDLLVGAEGIEPPTVSV
ncbi:hypothetical protein D1871_22970 [Nakamurella silvestris]|nr:hypothetical protein D1871_22970 [Nakamurella silvestris]